MPLELVNTLPELRAKLSSAEGRSSGFTDIMSEIRDLRGLYRSFSQSFGNSMLFNLSKFYFLSLPDIVRVQQHEHNNS